MARWEELFHEGGRPLPAYKTALRTRALAWIATRFGPGIVLPLMLAEEGREVQAYLGLARHSTQPADAQGGGRHRVGFRRARARAVGDDGPRRRAVARRRLRRLPPQRRVRLQRRPDGELRTRRRRHRRGRRAAHRDHQRRGRARLPTRCRWASSGYLAAKSEAEVQAHQIDMERHEMRLMPDLEEDELAVIYEAKGLPPSTARETARAMMQDPAQALDAMVREELNIHPAELAPLKDGLVTGTATAIGAFIPIVPFCRDAHTARRSGRRSRSACSRTSRSARRAASSPAAASGRAAATCSSSASASRPSATSIGELVTRLLVTAATSCAASARRRRPTRSGLRRVVP